MKRLVYRFCLAIAPAALLPAVAGAEPNSVVIRLVEASPIKADDAYYAPTALQDEDVPPAPPDFPAVEIPADKSLREQASPLGAELAPSAAPPASGYGAGHGRCVVSPSCCAPCRQTETGCPVGQLLSRILSPDPANLRALRHPVAVERHASCRRCVPQYGCGCAGGGSHAGAGPHAPAAPVPAAPSGPDAPFHDDQAAPEFEPSVSFDLTPPLNAAGERGHEWTSLPTPPAINR